MRQHHLETLEYQRKGTLKSDEHTHPTGREVEAQSRGITSFPIFFNLYLGWEEVGNNKAFIGCLLSARIHAECSNCPISAEIMPYCLHSRKTEAQEKVAKFSKITWLV